MTRGSIIASLPAARSKYGAIRTELDGHSFASKREAMRYAALKLEQIAGRIRNLELQPKFQMLVNGVVIGKYTADFAYFRGEERIIEDVKSPASRTEAYKLRKRIVEAQYCVKIIEVA